MDILDKRIRNFMVVVEMGSFSAAARELYLTQPALSKQITSLERESGTKLFDRSGYKPVLTAQGEAFYEGCRRLSQECQALLERLQEQDRPCLTIGFTGSFENREIIEFINRFVAEENISVDFRKNSFEECLQDLLSDRVDVSFGIESTYCYTNGIRYDRLHSYDMCVIVSHNHPLARRDAVDITEIKNEPVVCLSPAFGRGLYHDYMKAYAKDHLTPNIVREAASFDELLFCVSVGEGIGITSRNVVQDGSVKAVKLLNSHHASHYVVAYREGVRDQVALNFIGQIREYFNSIT